MREKMAMAATNAISQLKKANKNAFPIDHITPFLSGADYYGNDHWFK